VASTAKNSDWDAKRLFSVRLLSTCLGCKVQGSRFKNSDWDVGCGMFEVQEFGFGCEEVVLRETFEHLLCRKVDVRLPGKRNSNSHGARPVHLIITIIKWIRTSRFSKNLSLRLLSTCDREGESWFVPSNRWTRFVCPQKPPDKVLASTLTEG